MDRQRGGWRVAALGTLAVLVGLALAVGGRPAGVAEAQQPAVPWTFFGQVTAGDGDVEGGLAVTAYIGDVLCSEDGTQPTIRDEEQGVTSYRVDVVSDEARTGCGVEGAEVRFRIGDRLANETGVWGEEPKMLALTLPAPPPEPEEPVELEEGDETTEPTEPVEPTEPEEPVEPTEPEEGDETPTEPEEGDETPTETETEDTTETETEDTTETETEATETPEATEVATETPEPTPVPTATPAPTEAPTPTAAATPVATEAPTEAPTPVATEPPAATEAAPATEAPAPPEPEDTGSGGGTGTTIILVILSIVAGLAAISAIVFSWLGRPSTAGGGGAMSIGNGPGRLWAQLRDGIRSRMRRQ